MWVFRVRSLGRSYRDCKSLSHSLNPPLDYSERATAYRTTEAERARSRSSSSAFLWRPGWTRASRRTNERPRWSALSAFELRFPIKWIVPVAARRIFQEVQLSVLRFPEPVVLWCFFFSTTCWSNGRLDREARGNDDGQNVATSRETRQAPLTKNSDAKLANYLEPRGKEERKSKEDSISITVII